MERTNRISALIAISLPIVLLAIAFSLIDYLDRTDIPLFSKLAAAPFMGGNILHLILLAILSLWLISYIQRYRKDWTSYTSKRPLISASVGYLLVTGMIVGIGLCTQHLILDSGISFDFQNVLQLNKVALISLLAILTLLIALLLSSLWIVRGIQQIMPSRNQRFISIGIAIVSSIPLIFLLHFSFPLLALLLIITLFITLLDFFVELDTASPAWLILWLALLTAFTTGMLFKFHLENAQKDRLTFAKSLVNPVDSLAEKSLDRLIKSLNNIRATDQEQIQHQLSLHPYLNKNYKLNIDSFSNKYTNVGWQKLLPNENYNTYELKALSKDSQLIPLNIQPIFTRNKRVLFQLIPNSPFIKSSYGFNIRHNEKTIAQRGVQMPAWLENQYWQKTRNTGLYESIDSQWARLYYSNSEENGYTVMITESLGGYIKPISLFSYLFAILTTLVLFLFWINPKLKFFPATPGILFFGAPSLRNRIQLSTIALTLAAFLLAGLATVAFLRRNHLKEQSDRLMEKVNIVMRDIQQSNKALEEKALMDLAIVHQVDISAYSEHGSLAATSFPYLYQQHILEPHLPQDIINRKNRRPVIVQEKAGQLDYISAYIPFNRHNSTISYLSIAFSSGEQDMKKAAITFIGNLLNLYVFLLLIAGASAIAVAKTITRPLLDIGEKLRSFQLGKNEPLEWKTKDEIGQLIEAYNAMIEELEVSTEKLKQSEREGAWREMAKQVAHEIKNPLTPMKLSIQYLQHAQKSDPERAKAMISRVSQTLIEQIDGLAHIATSFSNFAKMPKAELKEVDIQAIIQSVYNLFTEGQSPETAIYLQAPSESIYVIADPKQLTRIFNNLIKNAQQAIPEAVEGEINIALTIKEEEVVVAVEDNGSGIPPDIESKVFQPNFTTKSSGMGLGLAMCKNMIEAMNGSIYFETEQGKGTTFFVVLPLKQKTDA